MRRFIGAALSLGQLFAPFARAEDLPLGGGAGTPQARGAGGDGAP